jgi:hypothetical protein
VSVDGPRANLILANPNGLVINGGSFINFGSVALVAGSVALESRGGRQRCPDLRFRHLGGAEPSASAPTAWRPI